MTKGVESQSEKSAPDARYIRIVRQQLDEPKNEIALLSAEAASSAISNLMNHRSSS